MNPGMSKVDWIVVYCVVTIPIGLLWLWVESREWRQRWRDWRRRKARPGFVDLTKERL